MRPWNLGCFTLALLTSSVAAAQSQYHITDLGTLGGGFGRATGVNARGQVAGFASTSDGRTVHPFLWTPDGTDGPPGNPQMKDLGTLAVDGKSGDAFALAMNNLGQVVGVSETGPYDGFWGRFHAFLWTPGGTDGVPWNRQMKDLGILPTTDDAGSAAYAVNDAGQVVGSSFTRPSPSDWIDGGIHYYNQGNNHAFLWTPAGTAGDPSNPQMQDLGVLSRATSCASWDPNVCFVNGDSTAYAINNAGQVVGASAKYELLTGTVNSNFIWTPSSPNGTTGAMTELIGPGYSYAMVTGINASGMIVSGGVNPFNNANGLGLYWSSPSATPIAIAGSGYGAAINDSGQIVGMIRLTQNWQPQHAALWAQATGSPTDLGTLGGTNSSAQSINATSEIAGWSETAAGATHPALWRTPEQMMRDLIQAIQSLPSTIRNQLASKISANGTSRNQLCAFEHAVRADANAGKISGCTAKSLIDQADAIVIALGQPSCQVVAPACP